MQLAPVVLFTYNRPRHTKRAVEALKGNGLSEFTDLIIYSDGPKNLVDCDNVNSVRDYLKTIFGFKTIKIIESEQNKGLADSVISGVTETISQFGRVIVLEDDLVTSSSFLHYMNQALDIFVLAENVMQISGYMFDVNVEADTGVCFLPFTTSWGWATWKRSWDCFDPFMTGYEKLKSNRALRYKFDLDGSYNYFRMLESQKNGKIDSWAIKWYLSVFLMGGLTLYPVRSLVKNIGFDGSGVHCCHSSKDHHLSIVDYTVHNKIQYAALNVNKSAYKKITLFLRSQQPFRTKINCFFRKAFVA